jgi:hypothetical protein
MMLLISQGMNEMKTAHRKNRLAGVAALTMSAAALTVTLTACGPRPEPPKPATASATPAQAPAAPAPAVTDLSNGFKANLAAGNIYSHAGIKEPLGIRTNGKSGALMFGPYAKAKAGTYKVVLQGEVRGVLSEPPVFDIVAKKGAATFFKTALKVGKGELATATFKVDQDVSDFEVRVFVDGKADMTITGYELSVVSN